MKIQLEDRSIVGKKLGSLRKEGMTPAICYGNKQDSKMCSVKTQELINILKSDEVVLETDGAIKGMSVLIQDISFHPVSNIPQHIDLLFVDANTEVESDVQINIIGEAMAVKVGDGQLLSVKDTILISALPQDIPGHLDVDVSELKEVHSHLTAGDIKLPQGVTLVTNPEEIILSIVEQTKEEEEEEVNEFNADEIEISSPKGKQDEIEEDE